MSRLTNFIKEFQYKKIKELNLNKKDINNNNMKKIQKNDDEENLKEQKKKEMDSFSFNQLTILNSLTENIQLKEIEIDNGFLSIICIMIVKFFQSIKSIEDVSIEKVLEKSQQAFFLNAVIRYTTGCRLFIICELISKHYSYKIKCGEGKEMIFSIRDISTHQEFKDIIFFHKKLGCKTFIINFKEKPICLFFKENLYYFIDPGNEYTNIKDKIFYYKSNRLNQVIDFIFKFIIEEMCNNDQDDGYFKLFILFILVIEALFFFFFSTFFSSLLAAINLIRNKRKNLMIFYKIYYY